LTDAALEVDGGQVVAEVVVARQFRGPPNSGNGGYVCGLLAERLNSPVVTGVLRAPIAVDTPLRIVAAVGGGVRLTGLTGDLIAEARSGDPAELPEPPAPPSLEAAIEAGRRFIGLTRTFHPVCFSCAPDLEEGYGLRVFVGRLEGDTDGVLAGPWTPHANFADEDGLARIDAVWAALDCPGSFAWVERGGNGGLLGTMTCEIRRRPRAGETCIVVAWPIEASGRKSVAGTALFSPDGELMARSRQIWIGRAADAA
jgi:hypothetical protein